MKPAGSPVFSAAAIEKDLGVRRVGTTCIVYPSVSSTNDVLRSVQSDRRYDGLAVFANQQTQGRGRAGRSWLAAPNSSVLCSVLLIFDGQVGRYAGPVNLAAALAAALAVRRTFAIDAVLRWPNDVYVAGKKLGGILIEGSQIDPSASAFVIGIGLNVTQRTDEFPAEIAERACSAAIVLDRKLDDSDRLRLARNLLIEFDKMVARVAADDLDSLRSDWLALTPGRNGPVTVEHENRRLDARIIDLDPREHSLLVQDHDGLIWHLRPGASRLVT
ncbi:MAG: biotin--[acetyl-CoA-carboxylase] ligase [Phycisphaerae bacterium]|nr:biotin--[acetyl-CoA-carboxylase] ligase [Phycisphaerae bacterium]